MSFKTWKRTKFAHGNSNLLNLLSFNIKVSGAPSDARYLFIEFSNNNNNIILLKHFFTWNNVYIVFKASITEITSPLSTIRDLLAYDNIFSPSFIIRGKMDFSNNNNNK